MVDLFKNKAKVLFKWLELLTDLLIRIVQKTERNASALFLAFLICEIIFDNLTVAFINIVLIFKLYNINHFYNLTLLKMAIILKF